MSLKYTPNRFYTQSRPISTVGRLLSQRLTILAIILVSWMVVVVLVWRMSKKWSNICRPGVRRGERERVESRWKHLLWSNFNGLFCIYSTNFCVIIKLVHKGIQLARAAYYMSFYFIVRAWVAQKEISMASILCIYLLLLGRVPELVCGVWTINSSRLLRSLMRC